MANEIIQWNYRGLKANSTFITYWSESYVSK